MTAQQTLDARQKLGILLGLGGFFALLVYDWFGTALVAVGMCMVVYNLTTLTRLLWLLRRQHLGHSQISSTEDLPETALPRYTVLIPLYREAEVVEALVEALNLLDYPKAKLQILLLLEPDDEDTHRALAKLDLPKPFQVVPIPDRQPKTKPKACNVGLAQATGEYLVIYDAEDRPEPNQLKKSVHAFREATQADREQSVACFQAHLNVYNPRQNLLTRFFRLEYTFWFDILLPALTAADAPAPLGGTSNHFRTDVLRELGGWDAYNVTEDCDLGIRLRRAGYAMRMLDSVTFEEANSKLGNWLRQRSRWMKGYLQTYLVHMRRPWRLFRDLGWTHFWHFQVLIGANPFLCLLNPLFWGMFLWHLMTGSALVESLFPGIIGYLGVFSLIFGNFAFIYLMMLSGLVREDYDLVKYGLLAPVSWFLMSIAAWHALWELIVKPHYWQKTQHGFGTDEEQPTWEVTEDGPM